MTPEEQAMKLIEPYRYTDKYADVILLPTDEAITLLSDKIKRIAELEKMVKESDDVANEWKKRAEIARRNEEELENQLEEMRGKIKEWFNEYKYQSDPTRFYGASALEKVLSLFPKERSKG